MTSNAPFASCCIDFAAQYEQHAHPAVRDLERAVLGCDFGGTSYTTRQQADEIAGLLALDSGKNLLEVGSGSGWPGLYVARESRCSATLVDIPVNALVLAASRARKEGIDGLCTFVAASGSLLPFPPDSFDAIAHSDVLCCLPEKQAMLQECRRVAAAEARMLFYVIRPAENLSDKRHDDATAAGPPYVDTTASYTRLLEKTGWLEKERIDVSDAYLRALEALVEGLSSRHGAMIDALGQDEYDQQLTRRRQQVDAVREGLLLREMYLLAAA